MAAPPFDEPSDSGACCPFPGRAAVLERPIAAIMNSLVWPGRENRTLPVTHIQPKADDAIPSAVEKGETEVAYLAKRHRVSPAIVREIIRRVGSYERTAVEREIQKGKARR
jgi:hypothetical protein